MGWGLVAGVFLMFSSHFRKFWSFLWNHRAHTNPKSYRPSHTHVWVSTGLSKSERNLCSGNRILLSASRPRWVMRLLPQSTEGDGAADDITIDRLSPRHSDICLERACDLGRHWVWSFRERSQREQGEVTRKQIEILITMATPWASRHRRLRPMFYEQQGKYLNRLLSS